MAGEGYKRRVGNFTAIAMLLLAIVVDAVQVLLVFLPGIGIMFSFILSFAAGSGYLLWFGFAGVSFMSGKKATAKFLTTLSSMALELTGLLSALPMMTANVAVVIVLSRMEDAETAREQRAALAASQKAANDNQQRYAEARQAQEDALEEETEEGERRRAA